MKIENIKYLLLLLGVLVWAMWIDYMIKNSEYKEDNYIELGLDDPREEIIPRYKLKKCGHLLNNIHCQWCRYYRFHPNDKKYYKP